MDDSEVWPTQGTKTRHPHLVRQTLVVAAIATLCTVTACVKEVDEPTPTPPYYTATPSEYDTSAPSDHEALAPSDARVHDAVKAVYNVDRYVFATSCIHPIPDPGSIIKTEVLTRHSPVPYGGGTKGTLYSFLAYVEFDSGHVGNYSVDLLRAQEDNSWRAKVNNCHGWHAMS